MTIEYLEKEQKLIDEYVFRFYDKKTKQTEPIYDGVADAKKYLTKSKYRICWVLKEPYDEDGGGWSLSGDMLNQKDLYKIVKNSPTWQPIIYVTYSLLNGLIPYNSMDCIRDEPEMAQCLNHIAFININKMPADRRSNDDIAVKYEYWKPILHWQLKQYDPKIIIFGNTFQHFREDLNIGEKEMQYTDTVHYIVKNKKLYAHAYNPAQMQVSREEYVQGLIDVVKKNKDKLE